MHMDILAISDVHGRVGNISAISKELAKADLVLIAGDITNFGSGKQAKQVISEIQKYNSNILAVPGNCDPPSVDKYLTSKNFSLHCNCVDLDGIKFVGLGGSIPAGSSDGEENFSISLAALEKQLSPGDKSILVTHQPAHGTKVDSVDGSRHSGSMAIRDFIIKNQPILAVSGHIHEAIGTDTMGETTLINPGPLPRGTYGYITIDGNVNAEIRTIG